MLGRHGRRARSATCGGCFAYPVENSGTTKVNLCLKNCLYASIGSIGLDLNFLFKVVAGSNGVPVGAGSGEMAAWYRWRNVSSSSASGFHHASLWNSDLCCNTLVACSKIRDDYPACSLVDGSLCNGFLFTTGASVVGALCLDSEYCCC